jgi:HlyD family secretion protein
MEEIELRSEEFQEILGKTPPWILRWGISVVGMIVVFILTGSAIIKYPDIISAKAVLTGSVPPATITARSSGKLNRLYVADNQQVKSGDYLAVIDNPAHTEDLLLLKDYLSRIQIDGDSPPELPEKELQVGDLQSLYATFYVTLFDYREYRRMRYYPQKIGITRNRIVQYEAQYRNLLRQQRLTEEQAALSHQQYRRDSLLHNTGLISPEDLEKSKALFIQSLLACENMEAALNNMQIQIAQLKESLLDTGHQDTESLNDLRSRIRSLTTQLKAEIQAWELSYVLRAPIDGTVTFTNYWIENQNVSAGEDVFAVIPEPDFRVIGKALLPVVRSGKVEVGQKVNIRLDNFPENEYGILRGKVAGMSLVPAQSGEAAFYTVEISLPDRLVTSYRIELPCMPNMQGLADIVTEDISLLERLILPIKKILKERG